MKLWADKDSDCFNLRTGPGSRILLHQHLLLLTVLFQLHYLLSMAKSAFLLNDNPGSFYHSPL